MDYKTVFVENVQPVLDGLTAMLDKAYFDTEKTTNTSSIAVNIESMLPTTAMTQEGLRLSPQGYNNRGRGTSGVSDTVLSNIIVYLQKKLPSNKKLPAHTNIAGIEKYLSANFGHKANRWAENIAQKTSNYSDIAEHVQGNESTTLGNIDPSLRSLYLSFQPIYTSTSSWLSTNDLLRCIEIYTSLPSSILNPCIVSNTGMILSLFSGQYYNRFAAIVNTSKEQGEHWVAMVGDVVARKMLYYDPTGKEPTASLSNACKVFQKYLQYCCDNHYNTSDSQINMWVNKAAHQASTDGSNCGIYSLLFVIFASRPTFSLERLQSLTYPSSTTEENTCRSVRSLLFNFDN